MKAGTYRGASQIRCGVCSRFLHVWNKHSNCIKCSVKSGDLCSPDNTCPVCQSWDNDIWTLYLHAVKDAQRAPSPSPRARRRLSTSPSHRTPPQPVFPPGFGFPGPAFTGPAPGFSGGPLPASQPSAGTSWGAPGPMWPDPLAFQAYLAAQWSAMGRAPLPFPGWPTQDAGSIPPRQRSRSPRSTSSHDSSREFAGIQSLNLSSESAGVRSRSSPGRRRSEESPSEPTPSHRHSRRGSVRSRRSSGSPLKTSSGE